MHKVFFKVVVRDKTGQVRHQSYTMQTYSHDTERVFTGEVEAYLKNWPPLKIGDTVGVEEQAELTAYS